MLEVGTNSYVTLEEAELIIADMFNADEWATLTEQQKEKALKTAEYTCLTAILSLLSLNEGGEITPRTIFSGFL